MTDRAGGDGSRRPTKAERKDQARLEREQIQRQMAARKRNRNIGIVVISLAVVAVLVVVLVVKPGSDAGTTSDGASPQDLLAQVGWHGEGLCIVVAVRWQRKDKIWGR